MKPFSPRMLQLLVATGGTLRALASPLASEHELTSRKLHNSTTNHNPSGKSSKLSKVVIIVIIAIVVALVIVVGPILFFVCRSKRRKPKTNHDGSGSTSGAPSGFSSVFSSFTGKPSYAQVSNPGANQLGPYEPPAGNGGYAPGQPYNPPSEYPPPGVGTPYNLPYGAGPGAMPYGEPHAQPPRPAGGSSAEFYNSYPMNPITPNQAPPPPNLPYSASIAASQSSLPQYDAVAGGFGNPPVHAPHGYAGR